MLVRFSTGANPMNTPTKAEIPTKDRILALLSPPGLDALIVIKDARWIVEHIKELDAKLEADYIAWNKVLKIIQVVMK